MIPIITVEENELLVEVCGTNHTKITITTHHVQLVIRLNEFQLHRLYYKLTNSLVNDFTVPGCMELVNNKGCPDNLYDIVLVKEADHLIISFYTEGENKLTQKLDKTNRLRLQNKLYGLMVALYY